LRPRRRTMREIRDRPAASPKRAVCCLVAFIPPFGATVRYRRVGKTSSNHY
jgi:hypothetical protein